MCIINFCGSMACSWCGWFLPGDWRKEPGSCCNVKNEEIVEELMEVASSEDIKNMLFWEVDHCMASSRGWYGDRTLVIVDNLVPQLLWKVEVVHVIEKVCEIGASHYPHLMRLGINLFNDFKSNRRAGAGLNLFSFIWKLKHFHFQMTRDS